MSRKCQVFVRREIGKPPLLIIEMNSIYSIQDIFALYYSKPSNQYTMKQEIQLPQKSSLKKDNENESEYKDERIIVSKNEIKPWRSVPYCGPTWHHLIRWFNSTRNHVISYNGLFEMHVFEKQGFETAYLFNNQYDHTIEWYKIGQREIYQD